MTNNSRVLHERGFSLKYKQALKAIENCACVWVEHGKTIRDLTFAEAIQARNLRAKDREGLVYYIEGTDKDGKPILIARPYLAELYNTTFDHAGAPQENQLAAQANQFVDRLVLDNGN